MDEMQFCQTMREIEAALKEAGYDPYEQLVGYLQTGESYYITRTSNARELVKALDREQLRQYVDRLPLL